MSIHSLSQIFNLLTTAACHQNALLYNLVSMTVECKVVKVLEDYRIDVLLALSRVEKFHRLFDYVIASHVHHHFDSLVALFECFL